MADDGDTFSGQARWERRGRPRCLSACGRACVKQGEGLSRSVGRKTPGVADAPSGWGMDFKVHAAISLSGTRDLAQQDSLGRHRAGPIPSHPFGFVYTATFPLAANPRQFPERL